MSQVIAALDWVVEHRDAGGTDVRVVSLAYGTVSLQPWQVDPLARAVVSLLVPGSYADVTSPEGRVKGDLSERFFRGSGTS